MSLSVAAAQKDRRLRASHLHAEAATSERERNGRCAIRFKFQSPQASGSPGNAGFFVTFIGAAWVSCWWHGEPRDAGS